MSETVSEREFQSHTPWCQSRKRLRFDPSVCNCDQSVITGGSQAHEAGSAHDNVPAPDSRRTLALGDSESLGQEVGGSDTTRLQQLHLDALRALTCLYLAADEHVADDVNAKVKAVLDAQAIAIRTVREERDEAFRSEDAAGDGWGEAVEANKLVLAEMLSLRADVERLTAERDDWRAMSATRNPPSAEVILRERAAEAEQQVRALRASITHLHAWNSDDMQIRHRQVVLADDLTALLGAIKEP